MKSDRTRSQVFLLFWIGLAVAMTLPTLARGASDTNLTEELRRLGRAAGDALWVRWTVPAVGGRFNCCVLGASFDVPQSSSGELTVMVRLNGGSMDGIHAYTTGCRPDIDPGMVHELASVDPKQSVSLLASLADGDWSDDGDVGQHALGALAQHDHPQADAALRRFVEPDRLAEVRSRAAFWLGSARKEAGLTVLRRLLRDDPDGHVREQVVFAISINDSPDAIDVLLSAARKHPSPGVRAKSMFWLADKAGDRVVETLEKAAEDDPNADVRDQAVFAVSQLPPDQGVPLLASLARTNRHPAVRKRALFWLGQSADPRALPVIEEILTR